MARSLLFRTLNLQQGDFVTLNTDAFSMPPVIINSKDLARSDGGIALFKKYASRTINADGYINAPNELTADNDIDLLKISVALSGNLDLGYKVNQIRRWMATLQNMNIARGANDVSYAAWSAQFFCPMPFATDGTTPNAAANTTITSGSAQIPLSFIGTFFALPVISLTINSISPNSTPVTMTLGNPSEGRYLSITRIFLAGDIVKIDPVNGQIFHNNTLLQPLGQFPIYFPGSGVLEYSDTAAARSVTIATPYNPRYL